MYAPILLARTNDSAYGDALVRALGFDNSAEAESKANQLADPSAYEFSHVVLGFRGAPLKAIATADGIRQVRESAALTWLGGTWAAWWRAIDQEDVPAKVRANVASTLTHHSSLTPFGNRKYLPEAPDSITWPETVTDGLRGVWGGVFAVVVDRRAEEDIVRAGARVLKRADLGTQPAWLALAPGATVSASAALAWPVTEELSPSDRKLLDTYEAAYRRLVLSLQNRGLADALRLPFEVSHLVLSLDGGVLSSCAESSHPTTRTLVQQLERQLFAAGDAPAQKPRARRMESSVTAADAPPVTAGV